MDGRSAAIHEHEDAGTGEWDLVGYASAVNM